MSTSRTILVVFAHPDDEAYGPGGTLAHYAMRGDDVRLVTVTRGESGSLGISKELEPDELAGRRTIELENACRALGVRLHRVVGWPDSGLASVPFEDGVSLVLEAIDEIDPEILITFHRDGVSRHPDHIAVHGWVVEAFARADRGRRAARVYGWGIREDVCAPQRPQRDPAPIADDEIAASIAISDSAYERKIASIRAHVTQLAFLDQLEGWFGDFRSVSEVEHFELAASRAPQSKPVVDDLFDGLPA